ncbi:MULTISPECIES: hypothetical protein [unclassified Aminobacter]|uniref:hypothetical protein n=1 Tax=unclassified Aminobacter TaxID=2644704 RepID=UPI00119DDB2F|nr:MULTISPECIES: hypothetical protein [unclassified Aminobacter]TWH32221.1 hypothetical protein L611_002100000620 [Aminobacter sp. J15]
MNNMIIPFPQTPQSAQQPPRKAFPVAGRRAAQDVSDIRPAAGMNHAEDNAPGFFVDSPVAAVLEAAGHSRACVTRIRSGLSISCSCETTPEPSDVAAKTVGLAIRFARISATRQLPIPPGVITGLVEQVDAGNAAAVLVWRWLVQRGQIPESCPARPRLRIACAPS